MSNTSFLPMSEDALPPIPAVGERGQHVCEVVRFYLPILDELELEPEQLQAIREHVRVCLACAREEQQLQQANQLLAGMAASEPSARVDAAILAAIAAQRAKGQQFETEVESANAGITMAERIVVSQPEVGEATRASARPAPTGGTTAGATVEKILRGRLRRRVGFALGGLAVAALLFALLPTLHFWTSVAPTQQGFQLPAHLTWSGYVVFHSQSMMAAQGVPYQVTAYHDLGNGMSHIETVETGIMDVVAVGDSAAMLGLDMMRRVAQWGANAWSDDESMFNLTELRGEIATQQAVYLGKELFHGQEVYLIRYKNGLVLLLDMRYMPVNVLSNMHGTGGGEPVYNTFELMPSSQVTSSMWDMNVPTGFRMGTLPPKP